MPAQLRSSAYMSSRHPAPVCVAVVACAFLIAGCSAVAVGLPNATPSTEPQRYDVMLATSVEPNAVAKSVDCVVDAMDANRLQVMSTVRQLRRASSTRIDEWNPGTVVVSVEIYDDGRVSALVAKTAALIGKDALTKALQGCFRRS